MPVGSNPAARRHTGIQRRRDDATLRVEGRGGSPLGDPGSLMSLLGSFQRRIPDGQRRRL